MLELNSGITKEVECKLTTQPTGSLSRSHWVSISYTCINATRLASIPQIILVATRIETLPFLICHPVVGNTIPVDPDAIRQKRLRRIDYLFDVYTTIPGSKGTETYCCREYHVVVCFEVAESNLFVPQERPQTDDKQAQAEKREGLSHERRVAHLRYQLRQSSNLIQKESRDKGSLQDNQMRAYKRWVLMHDFIIVFGEMAPQLQDNEEKEKRFCSLSRNGSLLPSSHAHNQ